MDAKAAAAGSWQNRRVPPDPLVRRHPLLSRQMFQTWNVETWPAGQPVLAVMFSRK